jgi:hypothetical protein
VSKSLLGIAAVFFCVLPRLAFAEPEVTSNLVLGGGVLLSDDPELQGSFDASEGVLRMGLTSAIIFLRESNRELGLGFYAELMTNSFHDILPGAGVTLVLPIHHAAPLVVSAGAHYDYDGEHAGGVGGRLWWGAHNHNHYHVYNITLGLWIEAKANLWGNREVIITAGVDIDLQVLFTPWLWFARWAHGPARL